MRSDGGCSEISLRIFGVRSCGSNKQPVLSGSSLMQDRTGNPDDKLHDFRSILQAVQFLDDF